MHIDYWKTIWSSQSRSWITLRRREHRISWRSWATTSYVVSAIVWSKNRGKSSSKLNRYRGSNSRSSRRLGTITCSSMRTLRSSQLKGWRWNKRARYMPSGSALKCLLASTIAPKSWLSTEQWSRSTFRRRITMERLTLNTWQMNLRSSKSWRKMKRNSKSMRGLKSKWSRSRPLSCKTSSSVYRGIEMSS